MSLPVIAVPVGDPAGVGPEIVLKALGNAEIYRLCRPLVYADPSHMQRTADSLRLNISLNLVTEPASGLYQPGRIDLIPVNRIDLSAMPIGQISPLAGRSAYECIVRATEDAVNGRVDAMATAPINKEAIKAAGIEFIGHTEMLAALTGVADPLTMFQVHNLRVFFLSRHLSLQQACAFVTRPRLVECLLKCDAALKRLGVKGRKIAVAGLNPHCGEHGLFGDEELREIGPAVLEAQQLGVSAFGPLPADSVFHLALSGRFDAVLSLYHDQGHIATKTYDFERTISVTTGLPFIRTSVDHGTAFDISGKGCASSISMEEAIKIAAGYALTS